MDGRDSEIDWKSRAIAAEAEAAMLMAALRETATAWMDGDTYLGDPRVVYETAMALCAKAAAHD